MVPVIYALGSNGAGQLGIGHLNDVAEAERCVFVSRGSTSDGGEDQVDPGDKVKKIVTGGNHTLILMEKGRVFAAGRNDDGRLGLQFEGHQDNARVKFEEVDFSEVKELTTCSGGHDRRVTDIAATWEASFFVFNHRIIFTCGSGSKGELGLGTDIQEAMTFGKVFELQEPKVHIVAIAACMAHVVVITSDGLIFGWGGCRKGQLGHGVKEEKVLWTPRRLGDGLSLNPERVIVGREYTVLMGSGEEPVFWGNSKFFKVEDIIEIGQAGVLISGWSSMHSLPSPPTGLVRSIGRHDRGQLASNHLPPIQALAAGSEHWVGITSDRKVIAWGWGEHGNCGEQLDNKGNVIDRWNEIPIPQLGNEMRVRAVAAGCATTFIICERSG